MTRKVEPSLFLSLSLLELFSPSLFSPECVHRGDGDGARFLAQGIHPFLH